MKKSNKWEQADRWYGEQPMPQREVQAPRPMGGGKVVRNHPGRFVGVPGGRVLGVFPDALLPRTVTRR